MAETRNNKAEPSTGQARPGDVADGGKVADKTKSNKEILKKLREKGPSGKRSRKKKKKDLDESPIMPKEVTGGY